VYKFNQSQNKEQSETIPTTIRQRPKTSQASPLKAMESQASSCDLYFFFLYTHINLSIIEFIVPYGACFFKRITTTSRAHQLAMEDMVVYMKFFHRQPYRKFSSRKNKVRFLVYG
jgi:hypothetical protein